MLSPHLKIFNYKKPAFWIILVCVIISLTLTVFFMTTHFGSNNTVSTSNQLSKELTSAINSTLSFRYDHSTDYPVYAYEVIGSEINDEYTTVYLWILFTENEYNRRYRRLDELSQSFILSAITLHKTDNGYTFQEYWEPREGNNYNKDLKDKLPVSLWGKAADPQKYSEKLNAEVIEKRNRITSANNYIDSAQIETIKAKFPEYFALSTNDGLAVYVWKEAEDQYCCGIAEGKDRGYLDPALQELRPTTVDEMKTILYYYNELRENTIIYPLIKKASPYQYAIDIEYYEEIQELFYSSSFVSLPVCSINSIHDEWGLSLSCSSTSVGEITMTLYRYLFYTTKKARITCGPEYDIKVVHNGEIITFGEYMRNVLKKNYEDKVFVWDSVIYTMSDDDAYTFKVNLDMFTPDFPAGKYIICKPVTIVTESGKEISKTYYYTLNYSPTNPIVEQNLDFSTLNLSSADNILVIWKTLSKTFDMSDEIVSKIKAIKGHSPKTSFDNYEYSHTVYIRRGEQILYQFTISFDNEIYYGNYDNFYSTSYTSDSAVSDLIRYLTPHFRPTSQTIYPPNSLPKH